MLRSLETFGAPLQALSITVDDLSTPGRVCQFGVPPRRIDVLTQISGVEFEDAWQGRVVRRLADMRLPFLGLEAYKANKKAAGREKDLADIALLNQISSSSTGNRG